MLRNIAWKSLKEACAARGMPVPIQWTGATTQMIEEALASVQEPIIITQEPIVAAVQPIVAEVQPIVAEVQPIVAEPEYVVTRRAIAAELHARVLPAGTAYTKFVGDNLYTIPREYFDRIINGWIYRSRGLDEAANRISKGKLEHMFEFAVDTLQRRREYEARHADEIRVAHEKAVAAELARIEAQRIAALAPTIKKYGDAKTIVKQAAIAEQLLATSNDAALQSAFDLNRARILGYAEAAEWPTPRAQDQIGSFRPKVPGQSYKTLEEASQVVHPTRGLVVRHESDFNKFYAYAQHTHFTAQLHKLSAEDNAFHEVLAATHQDEAAAIEEYAHSLMRTDTKYEIARFELDDLRTDEEELLAEDEIDQDEADELSERITLKEDELTCMEEDMYVAAHKHVCIDTADVRALVLDFDGKHIPKADEAATIAVLEAAYKAVFRQLYMQGTAAAEYEQLFKASAVCANPRAELKSGLDYTILNNSGFCHSKPGAPYKFSINIRSNHYSTTPAECKIFAETVRERLPADLQPLVDMQIYSKARHFRLPYQTKANDRRPSRPVHNAAFGTTPFAQMMVSAHHKRMVVRLPFAQRPTYNPSKLAESKQAVVGDDLMQKAAALLDKHIPRAFSFHRFQGNMLKYRRQVNMPGIYCNICERTHDTENFFYGLCNANGDVSYSCFIWAMYYKDVNKRIDAGEVMPTHLSEHLTPKFVTVGRVSISDAAVCDDAESARKKTPEENEEKRLADEFKLMELVVAATTRHRRIPPKAAATYIEESSEEVGALPLCKTLLVHACKGGGKTQALIKLINDHFSNAATPAIIVALSHRQTFATEIAQRLAGFVSYKTVAEQTIDTLKYPRIVIQMESLQRLSETLVPDLLIIDESESIMEQISSPLFRKGRQARIVLKKIIDNSRHVVCMDANMSRDTQHLISSRGEFTLIRNTSVRNPLRVKATLSKSIWMNMLMSDLHRGLKIVIPSNSLNMAKVIVDTIKRDLPDLKVKLYSGESDLVEKAHDIANVNTEWLKYDVIIFTPTITAGVSFTAAHFDKIYPYFGSSSCGVDCCDQMTQRVRAVALKEMVVFVGKSCGYVMTRDDVITAIAEDRNSLYTTHAGAATLGRSTADRYTPASKYYHEVAVRNIMRANRSSVRFHWEMINALKLSGHTIETIQVAITVAASIETKHDMKDLAADINHNKYEAVASALDLSEEEAQRLIDAREQLAPAKARSLEKFVICKTYGIKPADFTSEHAREGTLEHRKKYRRIQQAVAGLDQSKVKCLRALEANADNCDDLFIELSYRKHAHAGKLLNDLGFDGVLDTRVIKAVDLQARVDKLRTRLSADHKMIASMYGVRCKQLHADSVFKSSLQYVNAILASMYGLCVLSLCRDKKNKVADEYVLMRPILSYTATTLYEFVDTEIADK